MKFKVVLFCVTWAVSMGVNSRAFAEDRYFNLPIYLNIATKAPTEIAATCESLRGPLVSQLKATLKVLNAESRCQDGYLIFSYGKPDTDTKELYAISRSSGPFSLNDQRTRTLARPKQEWKSVVVPSMSADGQWTSSSHTVSFESSELITLTFGPYSSLEDCTADVSRSQYGPTTFSAPVAALMAGDAGPAFVISESAPAAAAACYWTDHNTNLNALWIHLCDSPMCVAVNQESTKSRDSQYGWRATEANRN